VVGETVRISSHPPNLQAVAFQRPGLEPLEDRFCPARLANFWQPAGTNLLWSTDNNWFLRHQPTGDEQAIFDPSRPNGNKAVEADVTTTVGGILYQNGYSQVMTIDSGVTIETANGFDFSNGTANIDFKDTTSKLQADAGNSQVNNFEFTDAQGIVYLAGGTLTVGNAAASDTFSNFLVAGVLTVNNTAVAKFQVRAWLTSAPGGQMVQANTHTTSLWSTATTGGILENWGTFSYVGGGTGNPTEIDMPFLNHGSATFDTGQLKIMNKSSATNNYSLMMDQGSITLKNGITLSVDQGYDQTGGLFSVADATEAVLKMAANEAEFDGGNGQLGTATTYGRLAVQGGDLTFNGAEYDAKIKGSGSTSDLITTDKAIHIQGTSAVVVTAVGKVEAITEPWNILGAAAGTTIDGDFASKMFPNGVKGSPNNNSYKLHV
jgi:hypothetical protein